MATKADVNAADAYELVTTRLQETTGYGAPREGADWRCPAHGDGTPSLSVSRRTKGDSGVVVHCQAGCPLNRVLDALNLEEKDLFDVKHNGNGKKAKSEIVATYPYVDENGFTLFEVVRYHPKTFRQRVPDPNEQSGYRYKVGDTRRVIYRLPKVINAVAAGFRVWIVEGEKDVHAMEAVGEVATCNPGGADKWKPEYAQWFEGADVYVVADKDAVGRSHARRIERSLEGHAASVHVVEAVTGKDAADHINAGHTVDEFMRVRSDDPFTGDDAPPHDDAPPPSDDGYYDEAPPVEVKEAKPFIRAQLDVTSKPTPRPTIGRYLYRAGFTVVQSEPGVGKSWFALDIALGIMAQGGVVIYMDEEGGEDLVRERLFALSAPPEMVKALFWYFPFEARTWTDDDLEALKKMIAEASNVGPVQLAVLDSLPDFLAAAGLSEDKAQDVTAFVNKVCATFRAAGVAQLALDHLVKPEKAKNGGGTTRSRYSRGSGSKLAKADSTILLEAIEEFDAENSGRLRLWKTKDRLGRLDMPKLTEPGRIIDVSVSDGMVTMKDGAQPDKWSGPTECMNKLLGLFVPGVELSFRQVKLMRLGFRDETIRESLDRLVITHQLRLRHGPKNSTLYSRNSSEPVQQSLGVAEGADDEGANSDDDEFY